MDQLGALEFSPSTVENPEGDVGQKRPNATPPGTTGEIVVTEQPAFQDMMTMNNVLWKPWLSQKVADLDRQQILDEFFKRPTGLAPLAASDLISVSSKSRSWKCDWDRTYEVRDLSLNEPTLMFTALEELQCCTLNSLQNIVIRDVSLQPVARCCYKEKSLILGQLVLAVYAPPDLLIGSGEETSHYGCWCSPRFHLRNSEGDVVFAVEFNRHGCTAGTFRIESADGNCNLVKIISKTSTEIRLKFTSKISVTLKIIILGFCITMLHRSYTQLAITEDDLN